MIWLILKLITNLSLQEFYKELDGKPFEIVFVSSDHSDKEVKAYLQEMHGDWCFLPFDSSLIKYEFYL